MHIPLWIYRDRGRIVGEDRLQVWRVGGYEQQEVPMYHRQLIKMPMAFSCCLPPFLETYHAVMVRIDFLEEFVKLCPGYYQASRNEC